MGRIRSDDDDQRRFLHLQEHDRDGDDARRVAALSCRGLCSLAAHLQGDLRNLGIRIRTGIHTGEIEQRDSDVGGIAVHICARIMGSADADEILVSRTVKDLTIGSSLDFRPRGAFTLKGVGGEWELYAVDVDPR
jgi:class 3 adenylate cyclase